MELRRGSDGSIILIGASSNELNKLAAQLPEIPGRREYVDRLDRELAEAIWPGTPVEECFTNTEPVALRHKGRVTGPDRTTESIVRPDPDHVRPYLGALGFTY